MRSFLQGCFCLLAVLLQTQGAANESSSFASNSTDSWLFNSTFHEDDDNTTFWTHEEEESGSDSSRTLDQTSLSNFEEAADVSSAATSDDATTNLSFVEEHNSSLLDTTADNETATEHFEDFEKNGTTNLSQSQSSAIAEDTEAFTNDTSRSLSGLNESSPDLDGANFNSSQLESDDPVTTTNSVLEDNLTTVDDNQTISRKFGDEREQSVSDFVEDVTNNVTPGEVVEQTFSSTSALHDRDHIEEHNDVTTVSTPVDDVTHDTVPVNHPNNGRDLLENVKQMADTDLNINLSLIALNNFQNHWTSRESTIVDRWCMDCLCQASSGCENRDCSQGMCGPYQISKAYWTDAGKPGFYVKGDPRAFQACALNKTCAELTVRLYMTKFRRDCDQNGVIDCWDYARIHRAGPHNCKQSWVTDTPSWSKFNECQEELEAVRPGNNGQAPQPFRPPALRPENHPSSLPPEVLPDHQPEFHPTPIELHPPVDSFEEHLQPAESIPQSIPDVPSATQPAPKPTRIPQTRPTRPNWQRPKPNNPRPSPANPTRPATPTRPAATRPPHSIEPIWAEPVKRIVHQPCLDCICQAMSGCQTRECDDNICGAYQISRPYWQDAGKPGPARRDHPHDFQLCAWNKTCSEVAIQRYMNRFRRDCNSDGVIDCFDFARIHKAGPWACDAPWIENHAFWIKFLQCTASWHTPAQADNTIHHGSSSENMGTFHRPEPLPEERPIHTTRLPSITRPWRRPLDQRPRPVVSGSENRPAWASRPNVFNLDKNRLPWQERQQPVDNEASANKPWDWTAAQHEDERPSSSFNAGNHQSPNADSNERNDQKFGSDIPGGFWRDSFNHRETPSLPNDHSEEESSTFHVTTELTIEGDTSKMGNIESESVRVEEDFHHPAETEGREFPELSNFENMPPFRPLFRPNSRLPSLSDLKLAPPSGQPVNSDESAHSEENDTNPEDRLLLEVTDADQRPDIVTSAIPVSSAEDMTEDTLQMVVSESAPLSLFNPSTQRTFFESEVVNPVDRMCMDCICEATSNCAALGCTRGLCGPYALSLEYWADAGGKGGRQDFELCSTNKTCSEETVQGYIAKSIRDCDKDGEINCWDFARMHTAGLHNCDAPWIDSTPYWNKFLQCQARSRPTHRPRTTPRAPIRDSGKSQNQVPPGLRRPPFIVVPPAGEGSPVSSSNRRDLSAAGPEVVLGPDEQIMIPDQRPPHAVNNPLPAPNPPPLQPEVALPPPSQPLPPVVQPFPDNTPNMPDNRPPFQGDHHPTNRPIANRPNLPPIDQRCFHCICMAASNCEQELKCVQPSPNQYFCGQYHISWAYWADSGKPGDRSDFPGAWEDCLLNKACAERSIQSYMNKFAGDCNGDGNLDCTDFARIHKAGPAPSCNASWVDGTEYWHRFVNCWGAGLDLRSNGRK